MQDFLYTVSKVRSLSNLLGINGFQIKTMMFLFQFLVTCILLYLIVVAYFHYTYTYWKRKNVPYVKDIRIPFGNFGMKQFLQGINLVEYNLYNQFKEAGSGYFGTYIINSPILHIVDPDLITLIMITHSSDFVNRGMLADEKNDPINCHLFNLEDAAWKSMRTKLTPTFSSAKMKMMFPTMLKCTNALVNYFENCQNRIYLYDIIASFTTDVIFSCVFGTECNSIADPDNEFRQHGKLIFKNHPVLRRLLLMFAPSVVKLLKMKALPDEVDEFFLKVFTTIIIQREKTGNRRNDFIQILADMKAKAEKEGLDTITYQQMCAQCFVFFAAGFETSSVTMTHCFHELAHNQYIQDNLRKEIMEVTGRSDGKLTYDNLLEMKYLDKVICETLRKYPSVPLLRRQCTKTHTLPDGTVIDKGTRILISVLGLHRDERYYPKPELFNPERFSEENRGKMRSSVYLPFGDGPRVCIGQRFALMQVKAGICSVLMKCRIIPDEETPYHVELAKKVFGLQPPKPLRVKTERL